MDAYLGIDVGSVTTKFAVLDEKGRLITSLYTRTLGRPIEVTQEGLRQIGQELRNGWEIRGVASTGSARQLTGVVVGADVVTHVRTGVIGAWYAVALIAMTVAVGMFVIGRSGSALCDPDVVWQGHGGWHLFAAVAIGAYFMATSRARLRGRQRPVEAA